MKRPTSFYVISGIILLSIIGLLSQLISNPIQFFKSILVAVVMIGIVFFVVKKLFFNKPSNKERDAFKKAAKQSKRRMEQKGLVQAQKKDSKKILKKKSAPKHLTVIEGSKGKKKNRA